MTADDTRAQAIEVAWLAWLGADDIRSGVENAVVAAEPVFRADERRDCEADWHPQSAVGYVKMRASIEADLRVRLAADIEARCDKLSHRERIATPPEWPVCAKCMPYFNIARGESNGD